jgi:hypothetical protein
VADKGKTSEILLVEARERFKESDEGTSEVRDWAYEDIKFGRLAEQWPDKIKEQRKAESRPCLTINKLPAFIRQVVNESRQNKPGIIASPVDNGADPDTAEVISGLIRSIERGSKAAVAYDTAIEHAVSGGFGFFEIGIDYCHADSFDLEARIKRIANPFMVHWDPSSTEFDASDWNYAFVSDFLTEQQFEQRYPKAQKASWDGDDLRDYASFWLDDDKIRIAAYWLRKEKTRKILLLSNGMTIREDAFKDEVRAAFEVAGVSAVKEREAKYHEVCRYVINGVEVLEEDVWPGSTIPICPVWGEEIILDGKRHFRSMIRDARDPQTMFNFWRSATTELVALAPRAPWIIAEGQIPKGKEALWKTANNRSHPYLPYTPVNGAAPPQRQTFAGVPAGALQEAMSASDDMKAIIGIYDPSLGARSNETSGKAILARQRESDVSNFHFIDNLSRAIEYAGRVLVEIIPSVYSTRQTIRVLGDDMTEKVVKLAQQGGGYQQPAQDGKEPAEKLYDLSVGKYDVTVKTGPSYATQRDETRETLVEIITRLPDAAPLLGDVLMEHMDFQGSKKVAKRLQALLPPQVLAAEGIQVPQAPQPQPNPLDDEERKANIESKRAAAIASLTKAMATKTGVELDMLEAVLAALQTNPGAPTAPPGQPAGQPQPVVG